MAYLLGIVVAFVPLITLLFFHHISVSLAIYFVVAVVLLALISFLFFKSIFSDTNIGINANPSIIQKSLVFSFLFCYTTLVAYNLYLQSNNFTDYAFLYLLFPSLFSWIAYYKKFYHQQRED